MLTLAGHIFGCLFWGLLIAIVLTIIVVFIARGISGKGVNPVITAVVALCLIWQTVLGVGTFYAYSYVDDVHTLIHSMENVSAGVGMKDAADKIHNEYPQIPEKFIDKIAECDAGKGISAASAAAQSLKDSLSSYMWQRVIWAIVFMAAGCVLLAKFPAGSKKRGNSRGHHRVPQRQRYLDDLD